MNVLVWTKRHVQGAQDADAKAKRRWTHGEQPPGGARGRGVRSYHI
uniref:Uncharacterized protein n=1 Tax=Arundo donax TaxID=35708 RepID=A0A0A8YMK4_ARUDO